MCSTGKELDEDSSDVAFHMKHFLQQNPASNVFGSLERLWGIQSDVLAGFGPETRPHRERRFGA